MNIKRQICVQIKYKHFNVKVDIPLQKNILLVGENGSGKTSILDALAGCLVSSNDIEVNIEGDWQVDQTIYIQSILKPIQIKKLQANLNKYQYVLIDEYNPKNIQHAEVIKAATEMGLTLIVSSVVAHKWKSFFKVSLSQNSLKEEHYIIESVKPKSPIKPKNTANIDADFLADLKGLVSPLAWVCPKAAKLGYIDTLCTSQLSAGQALTALILELLLNKRAVTVADAVNVNLSYRLFKCIQTHGIIKLRGF